MQEASGADITAFNGPAQLPSIDLATDAHPFALLPVSFPQLDPITAAHAAPPEGRSPFWLASAIARKCLRHAGRAVHRDCLNMMFDFSFICRPRFQNEVIDG